MAEGDQLQMLMTLALRGVRKSRALTGWQTAMWRSTHGAEGENMLVKPIVVVYGIHNLAQDGSKRPCSHQVIDTLERQGAGC